MKKNIFIFILMFLLNPINIFTQEKNINFGFVMDYTKGHQFSNINNYSLYNQNVNIKVQDYIVSGSTENIGFCLGGKLKNIDLLFSFDFPLFKYNIKDDPFCTISISNGFYKTDSIFYESFYNVSSSYNSYSELHSSKYVAYSSVLERKLKFNFYKEIKPWFRIGTGLNFSFVENIITIREHLSSSWYYNSPAVSVGDYDYSEPLVNSFSIKKTYVSVPLNLEFNIQKMAYFFTSFNFRKDFTITFGIRLVFNKNF